MHCVNVQRYICLCPRVSFPQIEAVVVLGSLLHFARHEVARSAGNRNTNGHILSAWGPAFALGEREDTLINFFQRVCRIWLQRDKDVDIRYSTYACFLSV